MLQPGLIAFGSNQGDSAAIYHQAVDRIDQLPEVQVTARSEAIKTSPVGGQSEGSYLNAVISIETSLSPQALVQELLAIEVEFGRQRTTRWGSRKIDLDLLLLGQAQVESKRLTLPHPRMSFRRFVLEPASEIAPSMIHPVSGASIGELLACLNRRPNRIAIVTTAANWRATELENAASRIQKMHAHWSIEKVFSEKNFFENMDEWKLVLVISDPYGAATTSHYGDEAAWLLAARRFRGPTLVVPPDAQQFEVELNAAIESMEPS